MLKLKKKKKNIKLNVYSNKIDIKIKINFFPIKNGYDLT